MFDIKYIKNYIHDHKSEICCVLCGYAEYWMTSAGVIYCNGNYVRNLDHYCARRTNKNRTPYMEVIFNDGGISFLRCEEIG